MNAKAAPRRLRPQARSLVECLREVLTPALWQQARRAHPAKRRRSRRGTQPLVLVPPLMTWSGGDSQPGRFEAAQALCAALLPRRRRPGRTAQGSQKALAPLPARSSRVLAAGARQVLAARPAGRRPDGGFVAIGRDGSRLGCPRSAELERRLGRPGRQGAAPAVWVTALVHLRLGLPRAWRLGTGAAGERAHLLPLLPLLPAAALPVAGAGFRGFEAAQQLVRHDVSSPLRVSADVTPYTRRRVKLRRYREGPVYRFPARDRRRQPPLRPRLTRARARRRKDDVWPLTDVPDRRRLPAAAAAAFCRRRWEGEGQFRAHKRAPGKVKLVSRTVRLARREAEGSPLALQLMLARGALAQAAPRRGQGGGPGGGPVCGPREVLPAIRQGLYGPVGRGRPAQAGRLREAVRERRPRASARAVRGRPRRYPQRAPKPPRLLKLTARLRARMDRLKKRAT